MRGVKSILLALLVPVPGALASALTPCPTPQFSYICEGGTPMLSLRRSARGAELDLTIGSASANGVLGDRVIRVPARRQTLSRALQSVPATAQELVIVGQASQDEDACCVSSVSLPPPSPTLCDAQGSDTSQGQNSKVGESDTADTGQEGASFDLAITLDIAPDCPEGAANHRCSGALTVGVTGAPAGIVPITFTLEPNKGIETLIAGPLECHDAGAGGLFCRGDGAIFGQGLTLPVTLSAGWSYSPRTVRFCAALSPPGDPQSKIRLVQTALTALGYDAGGVDGLGGPRTSAAIAELTARFGLSIDDPLNPDLHALLGLGPFVDADGANNRSCASTVLPARARPKPAPAVIPKPRSAPRATLSSPDTPPPPVICDPATTVKRGEACVCRYEGMLNTGSGLCLCPSGARYNPETNSCG